MPAGRPRLYNNCMDLEFFGLLYFESCWQRVTKRNKAGEEWEEDIQTRPYTISGLSQALGMTRVSMLNYAKEDEFFNTIKKLKAYCETFAEERLYQGHAAGPIFNLCNNYAQWHQKQEVEVPGLTDVLSALPATVRGEIAKALKERAKK